MSRPRLAVAVKRPARAPAVALLTFFVFWGTYEGAAAQQARPIPVLPHDLVWAAPPGSMGIEGAWVVGGETTPGPYAFRVRLSLGARIPPHTHPDERNSTVLSGTLYVGFGDTFDEAKVVAIPPGGVYTAPAKVPHYVWAKDGDVVYQEAGVGPTKTIPVQR